MEGGEAQLILVTTLSYDQLDAFIRDRQISLDNADLIFGYNPEAIRKYLSERLGSPGYVMGIRGRINDKSVSLLSQLDEGLQGDRVILEVDVDDDDVLSFDVKGLEDAAEILTYGLPEETLFDQLDSSIIPAGEAHGIPIVCTPAVKRTSDIRITALNQNIDIDVEGITFVRLNKPQS